MFNFVPIRPRNFNYGVVFFENFLLKEEIQYILSLPEWHNSQQSQIGYSGNETNKNINTNVRESFTSWMQTSPNNLPILEKISYVVSEVNSKFFNFDLHGFYELGQLTSYTSQNKSHYDWHIDTAYGDHHAPPRKLSMSLLLSDSSEFEGGDLQVKSDSDNPLTLEQKQGRAWFFPSYMLHRVTPVTKGVRRSLVFWFGGPSFK